MIWQTKASKVIGKLLLIESSANNWLQFH